MTAKRLALFMQDFAGGGAERMIVHLANGLADLGHEVDLVVCRDDGPNRKHVGHKVRVVDLRRPQVMGSLGALLRYLRERRPDGLLSALQQPNTVACWSRGRSAVRTVVSIRTNLSRDVANAKSLRLKVMPFFVRAFFGRADGIVAVSKGVADDFSRMSGLPRERVRVIYNPTVFPALHERKTLEPSHPWACEDVPFVVGMGRLEPQKDFSTLLKAFARAREGRRCRLLILGEGEERSTLERLAQDLGIEEDVALPGFVENPYPFLARCAAFVLSSRWEGLPNVLIEALACGAPVVATDCESGPREILEGGRYGPLVPVGDVDAMATALAGQLDDPLRPPPESWLPYVAETVCREYGQMLVPDR